MRQFQRPSLRQIMKRNLHIIHQHKNKISYSICPYQIPSPCAVLPILSSYDYTSQRRRYSPFNNNASIPDATQTYAPSYAQYPLQLKLFQSNYSKCYNTSSSRKYLPFGDCQTVEELVQLMYDNLQTSTPRSLSAFWSSVPQLLRKSRFEKVQNVEHMNHQLEDILGHTLQDINSFGSRDLSTTAISLAKTVKNVSGIDGKRLPRYGSPQRVLHDLIIGENSSNKEFIFKVLAEPSMIILHKFDARHLSNLIYAYGLAEYVIKFEDDGSTLFDVFAQSAIPNLHTFNGQDLSNMLWSYANVKLPNSQLFEHAGDSIVAMDNLNEFWPQALSNILWAYATLNEQHIKLFEKVGDAIVTMNSLDEFNSQNLKDIVWAFATAREANPKLFKKVADHIISLNNLKSFNEQNLSNLVWAFATSEVPHPRLYKKVADHIVQLPKLNEFKPQAIKDIVWAFAAARESHPQLFKKLAGEAIKRQHEFNPQDTANFLWAFATNGLVDRHLFSSFVPAVKDNLDKYNEQELANVAWAYSVANVDAPSVFNNDFINACLRKEDEFILENLTQIHQWQLWQDEIKSESSLPESFQKRCYEAFISRVPRPSKLQDDVVSILSSMGLQPQEEVLMKSGYRIDAIVEVNRKQIAIEVDGPSHFVGRDPIGRTILKHRQVAAIDGMKVVSIPYWEWNKLKKDSKKKELYLRHLLGLK